MTDNKNQTYTVFFPDGSFRSYQVDKEGVVDIYAPEPREMERALFFVVAYSDGRRESFNNFPYICKTYKKTQQLESDSSEIPF